MLETAKDRAIKAGAWLRLEATAWKMRRSLRDLEGTVALWTALAMDEEDDDAEADYDG